MVLLLDHGMPATRISMCLKRNLDLSRPNIICLDQSTPKVLLLDHGISTANILDHSIPMVNCFRSKGLSYFCCAICAKIRK